MSQVSASSRPLRTFVTTPPPAAQPRIASLKLDCPAPSRWDRPHRDAFFSELARLAGEPEVGAIILQGRRLFDDAYGSAALLDDDELRDLYAAVSDAPVPVIAVVRGPCSGAGLELALACAARIAAPGATFGPLAGNSRRLPDYPSLARLLQVVDLESAAELLVFGETWDAPAATQRGLVDLGAARNLTALAEKLALGPIARRSAPEAESEVAAAQLYGLRMRVRREAPGRTAPLLRLRALECVVQAPARRARHQLQQLRAAYLETEEAHALAYAAHSEAALRRRPDDPGLAQELRWPLLREAIHLLDEGATPAQIDRELQRYGFKEGPFAEADRRGLAGVFGRCGALATSDDWNIYSPTLDLMADAGRLGGPDARGWFRHGPDGRAAYDHEVEALLQASATFRRQVRQPVPDALIVERCLFAAMNGAALLLEARADLTAETLDAVWVRDLGFPRWRGGPLFLARSKGRDAVAALESWAAKRNTAGAPCSLLRRLAAAG